MNSPRLSRLFISAGHNYFGRHGESACNYEILEVNEVECVSGRGLRGDRFFDFKPDYKGQVTFFDLAVFRELLVAFNLPEATSPALIRRNLFTENLNLNVLIGNEFTIGSVRFLGVAECSPCYWMDSALAPGAEVFLKGRGGLRCKILSDGMVRFGLEVVAYGLSESV
jgi:MOSC domain-containing protein YiiM